MAERGEWVDLAQRQRVGQGGFIVQVALADHFKLTRLLYGFEIPRHACRPDCSVIPDRMTHDSGDFR